MTLRAVGRVTSLGITLEVAQMQTILAGDTVVVNFTEGHEHSFSIAKPIDACLEGAG